MRNIFKNFWFSPPGYVMAIMTAGTMKMKSIAKIPMIRKIILTMIVQLTTFSNVILDVALARNGFVTEMRIVWMEKLANFYPQMNEIVLLIALRTNSNVWMVIVFQKIGNVMVSNFLNPLILWIKKICDFTKKDVIED